MTDDTDTITEADTALMRGDVVPEGESPQEPEQQAEPAVAEKPAEAEAARPEEKEPEVQKLVPHGAFEEERLRRKEAQKEAAGLRERLAFLEGQQAAMKAGEKPAGLTEQQKADWDKDPIAAGKALQAELDAQKEQARQSQQVNSIITTGQQYCRKFAESEPQFFGALGPDGKQQEGAYAFLRRSAAERYAQQGVPAHEIEQAVNLAEIRLINDSLAQGLDPARAMWHWAQVAGFAPRAAAAPAAQEQPKDPKTGQFVKMSEAEKIALAEKAQQGGKSLGSVPAGGGTDDPELSELLGMSDQEFKNSKYYKQMMEG